MLIFVTDRDCAAPPELAPCSSCRGGQRTACYTTYTTDYLYENEDVLILADLCMDQTQKATVDRSLAILASVPPIQYGTVCRGLFRSGYFISIFNKVTGDLCLLRDISGIKTGFWSESGKFAVAGNVVHAVAKAAGVREFDEEAVYQLLYLRYFFDGFTYYKGVHQIRMGEHITISSDNSSSVIERLELDLPEHENSLSESENVAELREQIDHVHKALASHANVVLLSGGIDSCVMLGALSNCSEVTARSFRLKWTPEDETVYARNIATFLNKPLQVIERDASAPEILERFDEWLFGSNTPYDGVWIFGKLNATPRQLYYAGQDTRLHTPALGPIDRLAFSLLPLHRRGLDFLISKPSQAVCRVFRRFGLDRSSRRWQRGIFRIAKAFDLESYIRQYFFHFSRAAIEADGISTKWYDEIGSRLRMDLRHIRCGRQLYNEIVKINWKLQYTDNMQDLQAVARLNNTYLAFPFYDSRLAAFSATIPMKQAARLGVGRSKYSSRRTIINKWMLRRAYRDKLSDKVFYRDKAVSRSLYMLFNGPLGNKFKQLIESDLSSTNSFVRQFELEGTLARFLSNRHWGDNDEQYLWLVYYIGVLCFYYDRVLNCSGVETPVRAEAIR